MKSRLLVAVLVSTALVAAPLAAAELARSVSRPYVAGGGDVGVVLCGGTSIPGIGVACFDVEAGETQVTLEVIDSAGPLTGAAVRVRQADLTLVSQREFCDVITITLPPGAAILHVLIDEVYGPFDCPTGLGSGTVGTVQADFRGQSS